MYVKQDFILCAIIHFRVDKVYRLNKVDMVDIDICGHGL